MQRVHIAAKYLRCSVPDLIALENSEDWIDKAFVAAMANYEHEKYLIKNPPKENG